MTAPLKDGAKARIEFDIEFGQGLPLSETNYILNQINGQSQGLSLWLSVYFNIISYENFTSYESIVEIPIVISSSTSRSTLTVSSDVKVVIPFSTAQFLIATPSS